MRKIKDIDVVLPDGPYAYIRALDDIETLQLYVRRKKAVRLQKIRLRHETDPHWSVQWWTFMSQPYWGDKTPQWILSNEEKYRDLLRAAVRYAKAEVVLTRQKSVRT